MSQQPATTHQLALVQRPQHPLRCLRDQKGITQLELAKVAKVSLRTIYSIERWQHETTQYWIMRRILVAFGLTWEDRARVFPPRPSVGDAQ